MWRKIRYIVFVTVRNLVLLFLALELFFRFIIPASNPPMSYFYEEDKMYAYSNKQKNGINTIGKTAEIKAKWHINNMGWNSPMDYKKTDKKVIAVVGSSYVTALEVDCDKRYPYLLQEQLGKDYEVYAFGHQGAPVSQHLWISRYVDKYFNPDILIFDIANESLGCSAFESRREPQYLTLSVDEKGVVTENTPRPNCSFRQYNPYKKVFLKSAFFRYLFFNLKLNNYHKNLGKKPIQISDTGKLKSREAIAEYLFRQIKQENQNKRIIFMIIPTSQIVYDHTVNDEEFNSFRKLVQAMASKYNMEVFDLTLPMQEDYKKNNKKFEFGIDSHWNKYGHNLVASLLREYLEQQTTPDK